jgi:hypothetical protein
MTQLNKFQVPAQKFRHQLSGHSAIFRIVGGLVGGLMFSSFAGPLWDVEGIPPALQLVDRRESREVFNGAAVTAVIFSALAVWGMVR